MAERWRVEVGFTIPDPDGFPAGAVDGALAAVGHAEGLSDEGASLDLASGTFAVDVVVHEPDEAAAVARARGVVVDAVRAHGLPADWVTTSIEPAG